MSNGFDPYHKWLAIPPKDQPPTHYRLLGIDEAEDDRDVIANAADQRMSHVKSFQSGQNSGHTEKLLTEIAAAKVCLLDQQRKASYDADLRGADLVPAEETPPVQPETKQPFGSGAFSIFVRPEKKSGHKKKRDTKGINILGHIVAPVVGVALGLAVLNWYRGGEEETATAEINKPKKQRVEKPETKNKYTTIKPSLKKTETLPKKTNKGSVKESKPPARSSNADQEARKNREAFIKGRNKPRPGGQQGGPPGQQQQTPPKPKGPTQAELRAEKLKTLKDTKTKAISSLDVAAAVEAAKEISEAENRDPMAAQLKVLSMIYDEAEEKPVFMEIGEKALTLATAAASSGKKDIAKNFADLAIKAGRRADDSELIRRAYELSFEL